MADASVITIYNPTLTNANTWYPLNLVAGTKALNIQARDDASTLKVSADQSTYFTVKKASAYFDSGMIFPQTLYIQSDVMGTVVEIIGYSIHF